MLTLVLLNPDMPCFANILDPDKLASEKANWSGSALCEFIATIWIKLSDWLKIRSGSGILIYSAWQGLKSLLLRRQNILFVKLDYT